MLSISAMKGAGGGEYYLSLAREDYYLQGGEPPGVWVGEGAKELGLKGQVARPTLRAVLLGFNPFSGAKLTQNAGLDTRHSGWDLTFSSPKSVSILWALSGERERKVIENAHTNAVKTVIGLVEKEVSRTRRGKGGKSFEGAKLVGAMFQHGTSRAMDPQLHTHVVLSNVALREDGSFGTLVGRPLFRTKMALGALYKAELSAELSRHFDLSWRKTGNIIELKGVSKRLIELFSKRRVAIENYLKERGEGGGKASEYAALFTRSHKKHVAREELFRSVKEEAFSSGEKLSPLKAASVNEKKESKVDLFSGALETLTEHQAYFSEWELIRYAAEASLGTSEGAEVIVSRAKRYLSGTSDLIPLGRVGDERVFSTHEMVALEKELLGLWGGNETQPVGFHISDSAKEEVKRLNDEGKAALNLILSGRPLSLVAGVAGSGKSSLFKVVKQIFSENGYTLYGAAVAGKAADSLQTGTGIESKTLHKLLFELENGTLVLGEKSVLVLDEAGMIGTRLMQRVCVHAARAKARVMLLGDEAQLQPIAAGGPFRAFRKIFAGAKLTIMRRQREHWERQRILELIDGKAEKAFREYAKKGRLTVLPSELDAVSTLVEAWSRKCALTPERSLILASENSKVALLNQAAQATRVTQGLLSKESLLSRGGKFYCGDRVVFTRNSSLIGVRNGSFGTITTIDPRKSRLTVKLDSGKMVRVCLRNFEHIKLGYAATTHKAQGATTESCFVLLGGSLQDRESTYVQASRARGETHFFVSELDAGTHLKKISLKASESRPKKLAIEINGDLTPPIPPAGGPR